MAKKSTNKNSIKVLLDFVTLVLGGLILGFIALPHLKAETGVVIGTVTNNYSGFSLINFDGNDKSVAIVLLLLTIFASLLILFAFLKLLVDAKVIKNSAFAKFTSFALGLTALAVLALEIANCITIPIAVEDSSFSLGGVISSGIYAVWATIIINAILSLGSLITSFFSIKK